MCSIIMNHTTHLHSFTQFFLHRINRYHAYGYMKWIFSNNDNILDKISSGEREWRVGGGGSTRQLYGNNTYILLNMNNFAILWATFLTLVLLCR